MSADRYARWSLFLAKIRERVDAIVVETLEGARSLTGADPSDVAPLKNALSAMNARVEALLRKVDDTFHEQDLENMPEGGRAPAELVEPAMTEKLATARWIRETWSHCKLRCFGELLRAMWPHVDASLNRAIPCTRCGAGLAPSRRDKSETVRCAHCGAVNQCLPEAVVYTWFAEAPALLALERLLPQKLELDRAREDVEAFLEREYRRTRERLREPPASKQHRLALARAYFTAFEAAKAELASVYYSEQGE